jgi:hypothetical protein
MAVHVLGLKSNDVGTEAFRLCMSLFMQPSYSAASPFGQRPGIVPVPGAAALTTQSALVAGVAPFTAFVEGNGGAAKWLSLRVRRDGGDHLRAG